MIRIVGLSATLPNYKDVGAFLHVSPSGLFHFGAEFRCVCVVFHLPEREHHGRAPSPNKHTNYT